jgi:hypothetical protein
MNEPDENEPAYRVGEALAFLVRRQPTFCAVVGNDVALYSADNRDGLPKRVSAVGLMKARGGAYPNQRDLYPDELQNLLDCHLIGGLSDADVACRGFLAGLSARGGAYAMG